MSSSLYAGESQESSRLGSSVQTNSMLVDPNRLKISTLESELHHLSVEVAILKKQLVETKNLGEKEANYLKEILPTFLNKKFILSLITFISFTLGTEIADYTVTTNSIQQIKEEVDLNNSLVLESNNSIKEELNNTTIEIIEDIEAVDTQVENINTEIVSEHIDAEKSNLTIEYSLNALKEQIELLEQRQSALAQ